MWLQKTITIAAKPRGFHLVTADICQQLPDMAAVKVGLLHLFIQHTSASLTVNENADSDVLHDLQAAFDHLAPENQPYYRHTLEGTDDMPAHIKTALTATQLTIPINFGKLQLGVWQGICLCEHRNHAGNRTIIATLNGST